MSAVFEMNQGEQEYRTYLLKVQRHFSQVVISLPLLFKTRAPKTGTLFDIYINNISEDIRSICSCNTCKSFINNFGGLVFIDAHGTQISAMWNANDAPPQYKKAIEALESAVNNAKVTGVFYSKDDVWGTPKTGDWSHYSVKPGSAFRYRNQLLLPNQLSAEKLEDFGILSRYIHSVSADVVHRALVLLKTNSLYRSEKCLGVAEWLKEVYQEREAEKSNKIKDNLLWRRVALAPPGFCHPKSTMIGTLLEDLENGLSFDDISKRFADKMSVESYQRPTAAPSDGGIDAAEKVIEKLGVKASLLRRYARLEDIKTIWKPVIRLKPQSGEKGLFSHLKTKNIPAAEKAIEGMPPVIMTWEKFKRTVLPNVNEMELLVPMKANFVAMLTAVDPESPPILQWDTLDNRNPVSFYVWNGGSSAKQWGLRGLQYTKINAVSLKPHLWDEEKTYPNQSDGVIFVLDGASDSRDDSGLGLFPEILKSELHAIRKTIEAFSEEGVLEGREEATACGILIGQGSGCGITLRVKLDDAVVRYHIDRLD